MRIYVIEANSHIGPPKRTCRFGQLLEHAPYCERDLRGPTGPKVVATDPDDPAASDIEVLIKHRGPGPGGIAGSIHTLPHHPFDVVGWDGCLPLRLQHRGLRADHRAACTSRRRCTRSSRATTSSSATSCPARSTTTRSRSRCRTTTPTWTPTR